MKPTLKFYPELDRAFISTKFNKHAWPIIKAMPGAEFKEDLGVWEISTKLCHRNTIISFCEKIHCEVPDEFKDYDIPKDVLSVLLNAKEKGAYPFQLDGIFHLAMRDKAILADDMGLGKTVQALLALKSDDKVLIVAPSNPKYNWAEEAEKWRPDFNVRVKEGNGVGENNVIIPPEEGEILILNYDIMPGRKQELEKGEGFKIVGINRIWKDIVFIADESHYLKSRDSVRHNKGKILSEYAKKTWFLTGTPMLGYPDDLWGMLVAGNMESECYGNSEYSPHNHFKKLFNYTAAISRSEQWGEPTLEGSARLKRVMFRRLKKDKLDLPEKERITIETGSIPKSVEEEMNEIYDNFGYLLRQDKMPPFSKMAEVRNQLAISRTEKALEVVEKFRKRDKPLIVFSAHKYPIDSIGSLEGWAKITGDISSEKKNEIVHQFQEGKLDGIAATIQAANEGITLTRANWMLFVDLDWTPSNNWQAEDRINRIGQKAESLNIIRLVSEHRLDQRVLEILTDKIDLIEKTIEFKVPTIPEATWENEYTRQ